MANWYFATTQQKYSDPYAFKGAKEQQALQDYQNKMDFEVAVHRYEDLKKYIRSSAEPYLSALLTLLDEAPSSSYGSNANRLFQTMALFCRDPKFIFGKHVAWRKGQAPVLFGVTEFQAFEEELTKFYCALDRYQQKMRLCQQYIKRGTTDLDRYSTNAIALPADIEASLMDELNKCYQSYFYEIRAIDPYKDDLVSPKADDKLVGNCIGKSWLLPLAHVILIRDAQYQMMNKHRYKKNELLQSDSKEFIVSEKWGYKEKSVRDHITYKYSIEIRKIISRNFQVVCDTNGADFYRHLAVKNRKEEDAIRKQNCVFDSTVQMWTIKSQLKIRTDFSSVCNLVFPIPYCDTDMLALKLAQTFDLNRRQLEWLVNNIPSLLWERKDIKCLLSAFVEDTNDTRIGSLQAAISAYRDLLNPAQYYSVKKKEPPKELSSRAQQARDTLIKHQLLADKPKNSQDCWGAFSSFAKFVDLTKYALLLCNAIEPCAENVDLMPKFLKKSFERVDSALYRYTSEKSVAWLCGCFGRADNHYAGTKINPWYLHQSVIDETLGWKFAKNFLQNNVIGACSKDDTQHSREQKKYIENWKKSLKQDNLEISNESVRQSVFSVILETSLHQLEEQIILFLVDCSKCVVSNNTVDSEQNGSLKG